VKKFVKIALIAAIAALTAPGCKPEIPEPHNEWFDDYNEQFDGSAYIDNTESNPKFDISYSISTGSDRVNTVTITFPKTADMLKLANPETELKRFLSFWTINLDAFVDTGDVSSLDELRGWTLQKSINNRLVIDLKTIFTPPCSGVVVKIDGTKYTYSNGKKMDRDGNGITGEKHYDDFYDYYDKFLPAETDAYHRPVFVQPGNRGWTITLAAIPNTAPGFPATGGTIDTAIAADLPLASFPENSTLGITQADRDAILYMVMDGFKVEKFSDGVWSNHAAASYDETNRRIIAKANTFSHMTGYRIVFEKGNISLETKKEFFGVKQRIKITGGGKTIYNSKINITRLEETPRLYYNNNKRKFLNFPIVSIFAGTSNVEVYSKDILNKNVVLRLKMPDAYVETITDSPSAGKYYFKAADLDTFKNNFKIYESSSFPAITGTDRKEIGIIAVEFAREDAAADIIGKNVIYITLDPVYRNDDTYANNKYKSLYIGGGLGYESGIGVFGSNEIWSNNGFKAYNDLRRGF